MSDDACGAERFTAGAHGPLPSYEHAHRYLVASLLFETGRVLDLASGSGVGTRALRQAGADDLEVVGLDRDHGSARASQPAVQADATQLPFEDGSFDGVICFEAIEHLERPDALLEEVQRVLRRGGLALLSTPNRDLFTERAGRQNPFHVNEMNPAELSERLRATFPHCAVYGQSVWSGSWLSELGEDGSTPDAVSKQGWRVVQEDLRSDHDLPIAPWTDPDDPRIPAPLFLLAVCASSARALDVARRRLGTNQLLHDRTQWLLGHYLASLEGLADRDRLIDSHAEHGRNLQNLLEQARQQSASLESHSANLERQAEQDAERFRALTDHAAALADEAKQQRARADTILANLETHRLQTQALEEHAHNVETDRQLAQQRVRNLETHIANIEHERDAAANHARALEAHISNREAERITLVDHAEALEDHGQNLEHERDAAVNHARTLEAHISNREAERITLVDHAEALEDHGQNLEHERDAAVTHASALAEHATNLEAQAAIDGNRITALEEHASALDQERETHRATAESLGIALDAERVRSAGQAEHAQNLAEQSALQQDRISALETESARAKAELLQLEGELNNTRAESARHAAQHVTAQDRAEASERALGELRASRTVRLVTWIRLRMGR